MGGTAGFFVINHRHLRFELRAVLLESHAHASRSTRSGRFSLSDCLKNQNRLENHCLQRVGEAYTIIHIAYSKN